MAHREEREVRVVPTELERTAFQTPDGALGWNRDDARLAISALARQGLAVIGGELWWVPDVDRRWTVLVPRRGGDAAVQTWTTEREDGEDWPAFVGRCAAESTAAVERWPDPDDLPADLAGRILYNLSWVSETEYAESDLAVEEATGGPRREEAPAESRGLLSRFLRKR
jgi:hypothetical protein